MVKHYANLYGKAYRDTSKNIYFIHSKRIERNYCLYHTPSTIGKTISLKN